jgi:hypothetical protein
MEQSAELGEPATVFGLLVRADSNEAVPIGNYNSKLADVMWKQPNTRDLFQKELCGQVLLQVPLPPAPARHLHAPIAPCADGRHLPTMTATRPPLSGTSCKFSGRGPASATLEPSQCGGPPTWSGAKVPFTKTATSGG